MLDPPMSKSSRKNKWDCILLNAHPPGHCLLISKTFLSWKCLRGRQDATHRESKESVLSAGSALIPETVTRSCHPNREAGVLRAHSVS